MTMKMFVEIKEYLRNKFSGCPESEMGLKITVKDGITYKVAFESVDLQYSFAVLSMDDTIAFVPYENIISVEY